MATKTLYVTNTLLNAHQEMSETSPGANATAAPQTGWVVGTGGSLHSELDAGANRASTTFTGTTVPDGTPDATLGDCLRSTGTYSGTFAAGNWTVDFAVIGVTNSGAQDGRMRCRLIKSANADGSGSTEITSAQQLGGLVTNLSTTQQISTATFDPGTFSLNNEYIFVQIAWERTGAGGMTTTDVAMRIGTTASKVVTADFTPPVNTDVRVSFPTPTSTLLVGVGTQEFRAQVRKKGTGGNPTARIELWEGGSLKSTVLADTAVSSTTGTVLSNTWDSSTLTTASGANVECKVVGTGAVGGTLEVGAIEWNAGVASTGTPVGNQTDVRWNTRAPIADSTDVRWNTRARVNDSTDVRWAVRTTVNDSVDARWAVRTRVNDGSDLRWNTRAVVNDSADVRWAVRTTVNDSSDLRWATRTRVNDSADLRWNVLPPQGIVGTTLNVVWNTRTFIADSSDFRWRVATKILDSLDTRWNTRAALGDSIDTRWAVRAKVLDSVDIRYAVRTSLADSADIRWATIRNTSVRVSFPTPDSSPLTGPNLQEFRVWVRKQGAGSDPLCRIELYETGGSSPLATCLADTAVSSTTGVTLSGTWNAALLADADGSEVECKVIGTGAAGGTLEIGAVEWNVAVAAAALTVGKQTDIRWSQRALVTDVPTILWNAYAHATDSLDVRFNTRTSVFDSGDIRWAVRTTVADSSDLRWAAKALASDSIDIRFAIRASVADSNDLRWATRTRVNDSTDLRWATRTRVNDSADLRWNVLVLAGTAGDTLDARWNTRALITDSADVRWRVATRANDSVDVRWAVRSAVNDSVDARWNVRAIAADVADLRWNVGGVMPVGKNVSLLWDVHVLFTAGRIIIMVKDQSPTSNVVSGLGLVESVPDSNGSMQVQAQKPAEKVPANTL